MVSELEVLQVGGPIEEVDMHDIQQGIDQAQHEDIKTAYQNLMCGSRNQPRAFVGAIERQHADYQAQHLAQDEFDAIVDSPWSTAASAKTQQTGTVRAVPVCCVLASGSRSKRCAKRWGGSRSGYYGWRDRPPSLRSQADQRLLMCIEQVHRASRGYYGERKTW